MSDDFPMPCVECLLHHPYKHAEPWTCPACGLIHAVVMPGVPLAEPGVVEKRPKWMTPEREEAIEAALAMADWCMHGGLYPYGYLSKAADMAVAKVAKFADFPSERWLEAAALLRDGWSPGDLVVRK